MSSSTTTALSSSAAAATARKQPSSEKLMVSMVDSNLPLHHGQKLSLCTMMTCGSTDTTTATTTSSSSSLYLKVPRRSTQSLTNDMVVDTDDDATQDICEIQAVPTDFGSFLLEPSHTIVGKDSNLYVTSVVDPLFFVLQHELRSSEQPWQPWDQIVQGMDATLRTILPADRHQMMHLFARMPIADDEVYYKFSVAKALAWLQQKFERVVATLQQQQESTTTTSSSSSAAVNTKNHERSVVVSTFHLGSQATTQTSALSAAEQQARRERMMQRCRADALQIVCEYLNETWKLRLLAHLNVEANLLEPPAKPAAVHNHHHKRPSPTSVVAVDSNAPPYKKIKTSAASASTVGAKKLAKVNTKGMKKMSAFFGVKTDKAKAAK